MGRAMMHLAIVFAELERDLAWEGTLVGLERVKATGKHIGRRGAGRSRAAWGIMGNGYGLSVPKM